MEKVFSCIECGKDCFVSELGISYHIDSFGEIDNDLDADHVALPDYEDKGEDLD